MRRAVESISRLEDRAPQECAPSASRRPYGSRSGGEPTPPDRAAPTAAGGPKAQNSGVWGRAPTISCCNILFFPLTLNTDASRTGALNLIADPSGKAQASNQHSRQERVQPCKSCRGITDLSSQHFGNEEDDDRAAQPSAGKQPNEGIADRGNRIQVHQHTRVSFICATLFGAWRHPYATGIPQGLVAAFKNRSTTVRLAWVACSVRASAGYQRNLKLAS